MVDCSKLTGRQRDICRGHDDDGNAIIIHPRVLDVFLQSWGVIEPERKENRSGSPKIEIPESGPGTELKAIFAEKGFPACHRCNALARRMNLWGPDGCLERLDEIVSDIIPRARYWIKTNKPWAHALLGAVGAEDALLSHEIRKHVLAAIQSAIDNSQKTV